MSQSYDQSHLDRKYFIDRYKYNCPYCNRNSVTYDVEGSFEFDWSNDRKVYGYLITCGGDSCHMQSMHLSNYYIFISDRQFFKIRMLNQEDGKLYDHYISKVEKAMDLDDLFFYHQPTTFFTLDNRINEKIRELISEAEGCAKMNYLVGASGCLRKAIYEFLKLEKLDEKNKQLSYEDKIKKLKNKYPNIPAQYFDALSSTQGMTSENLHEGSWKEWSQEEFRFLVETTKEVLTEIYVKPKEKVSVLSRILKLSPEATSSDNEAAVNGQQN